MEVLKKKKNLNLMILITHQNFYFVEHKMSNVVIYNKNVFGK